MFAVLRDRALAFSPCVRLLIFVGAIFGSAPAVAGVITHVMTFGEGDEFDVQVALRGPGTDVPVPSFDESLGTLTAAHFSLNASYRGATQVRVEGDPGTEVAGSGGVSNEFLVWVETPGEGETLRFDVPTVSCSGIGSCVGTHIVAGEFIFETSIDVPILNPSGIPVLLGAFMGDDAGIPCDGGEASCIVLQGRNAELAPFFMGTYAITYEFDSVESVPEPRSLLLIGLLPLLVWRRRMSR